MQITPLPDTIDLTVQATTLNGMILRHRSFPEHWTLVLCGKRPGVRRAAIRIFPGKPKRRFAPHSKALRAKLCDLSDSALPIVVTLAPDDDRIYGVVEVLEPDQVRTALAVAIDCAYDRARPK